MRAYTLAVLAELASDGRPIAEVEILHWANSKLADSKLDASLLPIPNFQSMSLGDGLIILHLIDCLKPGTIDFSLVTDSNTPEVSCVLLFSEKLTLMKENFYLNFCPRL